MVKQPDIWAPNGCYEGIAGWYRGSEEDRGLWRWPFGHNSGKSARAIPLFREIDSGMPAP
jgi:hypothetical protein